MAAGMTAESSSNKSPRSPGSENRGVMVYWYLAGVSDLVFNLNEFAG
jgi:hypothetical protein